MLGWKQTSKHKVGRKSQNEQKKVVLSIMKSQEAEDKCKESYTASEQRKPDSERREGKEIKAERCLNAKCCLWQGAGNEERQSLDGLNRPELAGHRRAFGEGFLWSFTVFALLSLWGQR